jgi:hypothetical protein
MPPVPKPTHRKRTEKRPVVIESNPLEMTEQMAVIDWLRLHRVLFSATVPDRRICKRMGYSPGVPDLMIYDRPQVVENGKLYVGVAIELKRRKGGVVSPKQVEWIKALSERGWLCFVAYGADMAIAFLEACGYKDRARGA